MAQLLVVRLLAYAHIESHRRISLLGSCALSGSVCLGMLHLWRVMVQVYPRCFHTWFSGRWPISDFEAEFCDVG